MDLLNINKLKEAIGDYVKVKIELLKLELQERAYDILARSIAYIIIILMAFIVMLFLSMGAAFLINQLLESSYLGFIIIASFYTLILIGVLIFLRSGKLKKIIENAMLNKQNTEDETA